MKVTNKTSVCIYRDGEKSMQKITRIYNNDTNTPMISYEVVWYDGLTKISGFNKADIMATAKIK